MGAAPSVPKGPQAVVVEKGDYENGHGDVYRNVHYKDKLLETYDPEVHSLYDSFERSLKLFGSNPCLGVNKGGQYEWMTYQQVGAARDAFGSGMAHLGFKPGSFIGIYSINVPEWTIAAQAGHAFGLATVALYDTLGPDACKYILNQAEIPVVLVQNRNLQKLYDIAEAVESMKTIVQFEELGEGQKEEAEKYGIQLYSFEEVVGLGKQNSSPHTPAKPEDLAIMCYTSGTTGDPKGVMLTHANMVADLAGTLSAGFAVVPTDVHISYLPLAHVFERIVQEMMLVGGGSIGFYSGEVTKLMDDVAILRPTIFASVPRLFNKLYDRVSAAIEAKGGVAAKLFRSGFETKKENLPEGWLTHRLWDNLVFGKVAARLGGRVRVMITGSAPLSATVMEFLRICFSCPVMEGYGQTECAAAATVTNAADPELGHVGAPLGCVEIKLVSVPEMDYKVTDKPHPRGEICFRGPIVCRGYYKMPEKTADTIDEDGWLHTGDIGLWRENGTLKVIDRKKNIFKLAQGEYVAPEKIENIYSRSKWIAQSFVYGNSLKASLVAIVVPDVDVVGPWAEQNGKGTVEDLCNDPEFTQMVLKDLNRVGKEGGLHGFEQVRAIKLVPEPFSVENNILTPTFKLKRPQAQKAFQDDIDQLYVGLQ